MKGAEWMGGVTLGIALLGAVLGIINTCYNVMWRDRIRLKVVPVWLFFGGGHEQLGIDVTNLSFLDVTVTGAGFAARGEKGFYSIVPAELLHGGVLPQRLQPRTSITILVTAGAENQEWMAGIDHAVVKTACGRRFKGTTPALRGQIKKVRTALAS
jgi:hypothetical protein